MSAMASQITSSPIVYSTVYSRRRSKKTSTLCVTVLCEGKSAVTGEFSEQMASKGAVTCAVCPESAWLVTFLIGNVSTGVVTWSALRCGASGESGKKVAAAPLSKTAAAAAAAKTWFAKHTVGQRRWRTAVSHLPTWRPSEQATKARPGLVFYNHHTLT